MYQNFALSKNIGKLVFSRAHKGFAQFKTYLTKLPEVVGSGVCVSVV
jgi:hypothetical protein